MNNINLEKQWKLYFNELGITYLFEEKVTVPNGLSYTPTFYLPEYQCFAQITSRPIGNVEFDRVKQLVIHTDIPMIILNKEPGLYFYPIAIVDSEEGISGTRVECVNICNHPDLPDKNVFLKNQYLSDESMFEEAGLHEVIDAVKRVRGISSASKSLEKQWEIYFDELNIDYLPNKKVDLKNCEQHTFSFYLPELECLVEVVGPPLTNPHHDKILQTVVETKTPVVFIKGSPNFRFYEMMIPKDDGDYDVKAINVIQEGNKFVELEKPMSTKGEFEKNGFMEVIPAIEKACSDSVGPYGKRQGH